MGIANRHEDICQELPHYKKIYMICNVFILINEHTYESSF